MALRLNAGYFLLEDFSVAAVMRFQFSSGNGTLAGILIGARAEYIFTEVVPTGFMVSGFAGFTLGQIQAQPPADGNTDNAPFVKSGLQGMHLGMAFRYRLDPNFGLFAAPEIDIQFPTFLMHVDLTLLGVEGAF